MAGPFVVGRHEAVIGAAPQRVFDYLADLGRHGEWNPEPDFRVTAQPDGPPGAGAVYRREFTGPLLGPLILRGGMGDSRVTVVKTMTIAVYEPYDALVLETRNSYNGLLHSAETFAFEFSPAPEGTRVRMVSQVEAMVPSAFIGPVYAIRLARAGFERLAGRRLAARFPGMAAGPYLPRIRAAVEAGG